MKKLIVLLLPILLTGCVNGNRDFETICRKKEQYEGFTENINYKIYSNSNNKVTKVIETYELSYDENNELGKSAFEAAKFSRKSEGNSKKYDIDIIKDTKTEYVISFTLDISDLSDDYLKIIDFERDFSKFKNILENKKEMTCGKK